MVCGCPDMDRRPVQAVFMNPEKDYVAVNRIRMNMNSIFDHFHFKNLRPYVSTKFKEERNDKYPFHYLKIERTFPPAAISLSFGLSKLQHCQLCL